MSPLEPLIRSHESDQIEADLKAAAVDVFDALIAQRAARVNAYGMAHRGDFQTVERFVKADGLAMDRRTDGEAYMRELYRAWRSHNPRRGLAFLRHYLQLLYPGGATVEQLWQDPARPYPAGASAAYAPGKFLTSRVRVSLATAETLTEAEISRVRSVLQSILPARIVLEMFIQIGAGFASGARMAAAFTAAEVHTFVGDAITLTPTDPAFSSVAMLLHFEGADLSTTFTDSSGHAQAMVVSSAAKISTGQFKFGTSSGLFDGDTDQIKTPASAIMNLAGDFTIEGFVRFPTLSAGQYFFALRQAAFSAATTIWLNTGASGSVEASLFSNGITSASGVFTAGAWHYVAVTRSGGAVKLWVDGVQRGATITSASVTGATTYAVLGGTDGLSGAGNHLNGNMDEWRITNGVARDVTVVPTAPFLDE